MYQEKNLPKILNEELRLIPREKRSKLAGGVIKGVIQLTDLRELKRLRVLAQDRKKWKELVENIVVVEEAGKRWRREERKRLQKKRNKRADVLPEPDSDDDDEEEDDQLYSVIVEMPPPRRRPRI